ncbi:MAG: PKD domain-containing protein [Acidimicrobiales bacterium]
MTSYGAFSDPPSFVITASHTQFPDTLWATRVNWSRLTFFHAGVYFYADPEFACAPDAGSCTYRFEPLSFRAAVSAGLGDGPTWRTAIISVPVVNGNDPTLWGYGNTRIAVGFYKTDNRRPDARIRIAPLGYDAVTYQFDGRESQDPDGDPIVRYVWEFGDGTTAEGETVEHTYTAPGAYTVKLYVLDPQGAQGSVTTPIDKELTITNVVVDHLPQQAGDEFELTATARNDSSAVLHCVNFDTLPDIRPKASFEVVEAAGHCRQPTRSWRRCRRPTGFASRARPASFDVCAVARRPRWQRLTCNNALQRLEDPSGHVRPRWCSALLAIS